MYTYVPIEYIHMICTYVYTCLDTHTFLVEPLPTGSMARRARRAGARDQSPLPVWPHENFGAVGVGCGTGDIV